MSLNAPREIPFEFQVFALDEIAWLVDMSTRTYACSATPLAFCEPIYWLDGEVDDILPDAGYFDMRMIEGLEKHPVPWEDDPNLWENEHLAWDEAREEAHANHLV